MRPRVLLISYLFPPAGGVAVQRMLSLARYLPEQGFDVSVLSARNPSVPTMDSGLVQLIPAGVEVVRTWSPEIPYRWRQALWRLLGRSRKAPKAPPGGAPVRPQRGGPAIKNLVRRVFAPDPEVVWNPGALRAAERLVRRRRADAVVVSVPPFSSLRIGSALKHQFPGLCLVSDFRDEWLDFYLQAFEYFRHPAIHRCARAIEARAVADSDLVLSITPSCIRRIRNRYPQVEDTRFACLPNGFDPALFAGFRPRPHEGERLRVAHVGTVYPTATLRYYLDALGSLPAAERDRFETHLVGRVSDEERPCLENRAARIVEHGFVPQPKAIQAMEQADVLLLTMTDPNFTSGKIYDYLATGKPILAISPPGGEVDDVIRDTASGWLVDPACPEALQARLREILARFTEGTLAAHSPRWERVERYARPRLAAEFGQRLQKLLDARRAK